MNYKVELVEKKDPIKQLEASKLSMKDLFNDLLDEKQSFKYQTTVKVELQKYTPKREIEFYSSSFQFNNKNCDKSLIWSWRCFSINFVQFWWLD